MSTPEDDFTPEDKKTRALHYRAKTEIAQVVGKVAFERSTRIIIDQLKKEGAPRSVRRSVMLALRQSREELEALLRLPGAYEDLMDMATSLGLIPSLVPPLPSPEPAEVSHGG